MSNYVRFDTCTNKESKQAGNKCSLQNFDYVLAKTPAVFDFEHDVLVELKDFLNLFK